MQYKNATDYPDFTGFNKSVITNIPFLAFSARLFRGVLWSAQACAQASLRAPLQLIIRNPRIFRYA
jgi:hypothetical protein